MSLPTPGATFNNNAAHPPPLFPTQSKNVSSQQRLSYDATARQTPAFFNLTFDDVVSDAADEPSPDDTDTPIAKDEGNRHTLYFTGFPPHTTLRDLLSVIKGGKVVSIIRLSEKSAAVTLFTGAADYLAWVKKTDVYLNTKRVHVKWADSQFNVNKNTINNVTNNGATRNILIKYALTHGVTEQRIRDDMDHIDKLVIIDITYNEGNAVVATNSINLAHIAKTCMMSRKDYKICHVTHYPDECDIPLPVRAPFLKHDGPKSRGVQASTANRFAALDVNDDNEESRHSSDEVYDEDEGAEMEDDGSELESTGCHGVSLDFLDSPYRA